MILDSCDIPIVLAPLAGGPSTPGLAAAVLCLGARAPALGTAFLGCPEAATAPAAYPEVRHLTSPMRKAARQAGLADYVNLWAGQAYPLTRSAAPAADLLRDLWEQAQAALRHTASYLPQP